MGAPSLAELRQQLEAASRAYPELRRGLNGALAEVRRAQGEHVPTRHERREGVIDMGKKKGGRGC